MRIIAKLMDLIKAQDELIAELAKDNTAETSDYWWRVVIRLDEILHEDMPDRQLEMWQSARIAWQALADKSSRDKLPDELFRKSDYPKGMWDPWDLLGK
jgi:hypothetical protein